MGCHSEIDYTVQDKKWKSSLEMITNCVDKGNIYTLQLASGYEEKGNPITIVYNGLYRLRHFRFIHRKPCIRSFWVDINITNIKVGFFVRLNYLDKDSVKIYIE